MITPLLFLGAFTMGYLVGSWALHTPVTAPEDRLQEAILRAGQLNQFIRQHGAGALQHNPHAPYKQ